MYSHSFHSLVWSVQYNIALYYQFVVLLLSVTKGQNIIWETFLDYICMSILFEYLYVHSLVQNIISVHHIVNWNSQKGGNGIKTISHADSFVFICIYMHI